MPGVPCGDGGAEGIALWWGTGVFEVSGLQVHVGEAERVSDIEHLACKGCGSVNTLLEKGTGPHNGSLRCLDCGAFRWLKKWEVEAGLDWRLTCPECGNQLRVRKGPRGQFLGCSKYPICKFSAPIDYRPAARTATLEGQKS